MGDIELTRNFDTFRSTALMNQKSLLKFPEEAIF